MALLTRRAGQDRAPIAFVLDGAPALALSGDTILTAILTQADATCLSFADGRPHAGFCLMGACQDCWVSTVAGERMRACTTMLSEGMAFAVSPA